MILVFFLILENEKWGSSISPKVVKVGVLRCELSYRRCTVSVAEMMDMVETEVAEVEMIEKEVSKGVVSVEDIENR